MLWESKLPAWQRHLELPLSQPFFDKVSPPLLPGNITMEKHWEHSTVVHAKVTGHNHVKNLAGLSVTNFCSVPQKSICCYRLYLEPCATRGASPRVSPNANILGFGGWHRVGAILESVRAASRATRPSCILLHWKCTRHDNCTRPTLVWIAGAGWDAPTNPTISATTMNVRASGRASPLFWRFAPCCVNPDAILFDLLLRFASIGLQMGIIACGLCDAFIYAFNRQCTASFAS